MKRSALAASLALAAIFAFACNDAGLVRDASAQASPSPVWSQPTPLPSPTGTQAYFGPHAELTANTCDGNADYQFVYPNDLDDTPTTGDAYLCVWMCAENASWGVYTPSEIIQSIDCDGNCYAAGYPVPASWISSRPVTVLSTGCNNWVPYAP